LLAKTGFTKESVAQTIDEWCAIGVKLSRKLGFNEFELSLSEKVRIYHYYVPVFLWCKRELELHTLKYKEGEFVRPLVIGISAPQGCGKTTIVDSLEYLFNSLGRLVENHFSHLQISCHFSNSFSKKAAQLMC
jgi:D-glycerate 3-kinase